MKWLQLIARESKKCSSYAHHSSIIAKEEHNGREQQLVVMNNGARRQCGQTGLASILYYLGHLLQVLVLLSINRDVEFL